MCFNYSKANHSQAVGFKWGTQTSCAPYTEGVDEPVQLVSREFHIVDEEGITEEVHGKGRDAQPGALIGRQGLTTIP